MKEKNILKKLIIKQVNKLYFFEEFDNKFKPWSLQK